MQQIINKNKIKLLYVVEGEILYMEMMINIDTVIVYALYNITFLRVYQWLFLIVYDNF